MIDNTKQVSVSVDTEELNVVVKTEEIVIPLEVKGKKGEKGDKGDTALSVTIGTTTTGNAGTNASVTNSGTDTNLILDFTIPKGEAGATGQGVIEGGMKGQILAKKSNTDYDTEWINASTGNEITTNKVTSLSSSSTDAQYPSAKCVYDLIGNVETILTTLTTGDGV